MTKPVHRFLARFDLTTWHLLVQRATHKGWSVNKTVVEAVKDATDD